jgi:ABC-type multidrug transport system fused ATPase/permease subunit
VIEFAQRLRDLMTEEDRRKVLRLVPSMMLASVFDVVVVASGAMYLSILGRPELLRTHPVGAAVFEFSGVSDDRTFLVLAGVAVLLLTIVGNSVTVFMVRQVHTFSWSQVVSLSQRTLGSYLHRPYVFFLTRGVPDLSTRVLGEVSAIVRALVHTMQVLSRSVGAFLVLGWLLIQEPVLALIMMSVLGALFGLLYAWARRFLFKLGKAKTRVNRMRSRSVLESLQGAKEIKLHGLEAIALDRFKVPSMELANIMRAHSTVNAATKAGMETIALSGLVIAVLYFYAFGKDLNGVLPIIGTYAVAAFRMLPTFQALFTTLSEIRMETHALEMVHEDVLSAPPSAKAEIGVPPVVFDHSIELRDVAFRYPSSTTDVVEGMNLVLPKGTWTAIVGTTGSGKTTVVDVTMGLLAPSAGALLIDGRPIRTPGEVIAWQKHVGYVPQTIFVTDDALSHNIAFGEGTADMARVELAAERACLANFVRDELPEGYNTRLGHAGVRLSGGQRQRLGIARAVYRSPALLVLDEATSALDNHTEAAVIRALREHHRDTTVLMVAHRLSTTRYCDRILMLERGRVVDSGTYDELLERSAAFQALVQATEQVSTTVADDGAEPAAPSDDADDAFDDAL